MAEAATANSPTSMSFIDFGSIPHTSDSVVQSLANVHCLNDREYVITEKADGQNFSYWYKQGEKVIHGRRTGFLKQDEKLSDYQTDIAHYDHNIENLHRILTEKEPELCSASSVLTVYGEYVGPNVTGSTDKEDKKIPYVRSDFYAFRVDVDGRPLSYEKMCSYLKLVGLNTVKEYARCSSLQEAMNFETRNLRTTHEVTRKYEVKPIKYNASMGDDKIEAEDDPGKVILPTQTEGIVIVASDYEKINYGNREVRLVFKKKTQMHQERGTKIHQLKFQPLQHPDVVKVMTEGLLVQLLSQRKELTTQLKTLYSDVRSGATVACLIQYASENPDSFIGKQIGKNAQPLVSQYRETVKAEFPDDVILRLLYKRYGIELEAKSPLVSPKAETTFLEIAPNSTRLPDELKSITESWLLDWLKGAEAEPKINKVCDAIRREAITKAVEQYASENPESELAQQTMGTTNLQRIIGPLLPKFMPTANYVFANKVIFAQLRLAL